MSQTPDKTLPKPRAKRWKLAGLSFGVFCVCLLLAEVILRLAGGEHDSDAVEKSIDTTVSRMTSAFGAQSPSPSDVDLHAFHALLAYDYAGADRVSTHWSQTFAKDGEDVLRVFVYGGSVASQIGNLAPEPILRALEADPRTKGRRVRLYSMGRGGYKAPQTLATLQADLSYGLKPDVVVLIDGFNEVAVAMDNVRNQFHPALPGAPFWLKLVVAPMSSRPTMDAVAAVRREQSFVTRLDSIGDRLGIEHSVLASRVWLGLIEGSQRRFVQASGVFGRRAAEASRQSVIRGPKFDSDPEKALDLCADIWFENSVSMHAVCKDRAIRFVHVLQPTLHDTGAKPMTPNEVRDGKIQDAWLVGAEGGYPKLRARGADLRERGVEFFDGSRLFSETTQDIYIDSCHYNDAGCRAVSEFTARSILSVPEPFGGRWSKLP